MSAAWSACFFFVFLTNNIKIYLQHGSKTGSKSGWEGHWETSQEDMNMRNRPKVWRDGRAGRKVMRKRSVTELLPHQKQAPTFFLPTLASPGHTLSCRVHRASGASRSGPSSPPCCTKKILIWTFTYEFALRNNFISNSLLIVEHLWCETMVQVDLHMWWDINENVREWKKGYYASIS